MAGTGPLFRISGYAIPKAKYRRATRTILGGESRPMLRAVLIDKRPAVYFSREDLTVGLLGCPASTVYGYSPDGAYEIMRNIVLHAGGR